MQQKVNPAVAAVAVVVLLGIIAFVGFKFFGKGGGGKEEAAKDPRYQAYLKGAAPNTSGTTGGSTNIKDPRYQAYQQSTQKR